MNTELLKNAIIKKYGSIRKCAQTLGIPPTTLQGAIENNRVGKMAVETVILLCEDLDIDIKTFEPKAESVTLDNLLKLDAFSKQVIEQTKEAQEANCRSSPPALFIYNQYIPMI